MIYISIGSNLGNRINNLWIAANLLIKHCLKDLKLSIILETEALLPDNSPTGWNKPFLNMIVAGTTPLTPLELLDQLKAIETAMKRPIEHTKWEPRIIDLDILLYDDLTINSTNLIIPHPELQNRDFLQHLLGMMGVAPWKYRKVNANCFIKTFVLAPQIVGVVNITEDSFSDGGKFFQPDQAIGQIHKLAHDGASIIELGAQSTRPGAIIKNPNEEYKKLCSVLDGVTELMNEEIIHISIDTFWPNIAIKLLENYNIKWINDVKGDFDEGSLRTIASTGCKFCCMHSKSIPSDKDNLIPLNQSAISVLKDWGKYEIDRLLNLGFNLNNIILDPGIGFGKSIYHDFEILRYAFKLRDLGALVMIGHSRKITGFSRFKAAERDIETIGISISLKNKVDFLRVHNVEYNMRALVANQITEIEV